MFHEKSTRVLLDGPAPGATVLVDGTAIGPAPRMVTLDAKRAHHVTFVTSAGQVSCEIRSNIGNRWLALDILPAGLLFVSPVGLVVLGTFGIDAMTQRWRVLDADACAPSKLAQASGQPAPRRFARPGSMSPSPTPPGPSSAPPAPAGDPGQPAPLAIAPGTAPGARVATASASTARTPVATTTPAPPTASVSASAVAPGVSPDRAETAMLVCAPGDEMECATPSGTVRVCNADGSGWGNCGPQVQRHQRLFFESSSLVDAGDALRQHLEDYPPGVARWDRRSETGLSISQTMFLVGAIAVGVGFMGALPATVSSDGGDTAGTVAGILIGGGVVVGVLGLLGERVFGAPTPHFYPPSKHRRSTLSIGPGGLRGAF